jgi:hypothetical protein
MSKSGRERARDRIARERAEQAQRRKRRRWLAAAAAVVVVIAAAVGITLAVTGGGSSGGGSSGGGSSGGGLPLASLSTLGSLKPAPAAGPAGPEGIPIPAATALTDTAKAVTGQPVDGISCQTSEQTLFHIHAHLTIFVNGSARQVPAAIGIPGAQATQGSFIETGTCFYWLHTHAADGIIHIESPVQRIYTLGDFFDEWGQSLGPDQVGPASGHVVAIYNGQVYQGNPRNIPLNAHAQIQLEVGTPLVAPEHITSWNSL